MALVRSKKQKCRSVAPYEKGAVQTLESDQSGVHGKHKKEAYTHQKRVSLKRKVRPNRLVDHNGSPVIKIVDRGTHTPLLVPDNRCECQVCGRLFNLVSLPRHMNLCQRVFMSTRKVFDSKLQRTNQPSNDHLIELRAVKKQALVQNWRTK